MRQGWNMWRKHKNSLLYVLLFLLSIVTVYNLVSFLRTTGTRAAGEQDSHKIRIGISLGTMKEERWARDRDILMAKAKELGAEVFVQNANNDDSDQLSQVKYLLSKNIAVLIIVPNDLSKAAEAVRLAKSRGVKVISYDRLVRDSGVDLYISFDNVQVGRLMAQYLVSRVPKGNYLIVNGADTDYNTHMLKEGYDSVLKEYEADGNIHILDEKWTPNWLTESAYQTVDKLLQGNKKIDAIIAGDDGLAGAAIQALAEHRLAGKVLVVGQDADLAACQRIVDGTQAMTVYKQIDKLAETSIRMALRLARGDKMTGGQTIYDGTYEVPYYAIAVIPVDKSNMQSTVIKDGFQTSEDVYRYAK